MNYYISKYVPPNITKQNSLSFQQLKKLAITKLKSSKYYSKSCLNNEDLIANVITIVGIYQTGKLNQQKLVDWEILKLKSNTVNIKPFSNMQEFREFDNIENLDFVQNLLKSSQLTSLEKFIIKSRFWDNKNFDEIANKTKQSTQNIHKIYKNTLTKFQNRVRQQNI